jgi:hypothetical protein
VLLNGAPYTGGPIPFGSTIDVTNGTITIVSSTGKLKVFGEGGLSAVFVLLRGTDKGKPIVILKLTGGDFSVCKRKTSSAFRTTAKVVRQIWGSGTGKFRTQGRYSSATVRGTIWLTSDRCEGTFTKVRRGVVEVKAGKQVVRVPAGKSFLAKP